MAKWDLPPEPIPSWLDPAMEITHDNDTKPPEWVGMDKHKLMVVFVELCFKSLRALGLTNQQALEVTANSVVETGWGSTFRAWNLGGWKISKADVQAAKAKGKPCHWWRAPGNKGSKDPPWCYYRGFTDVKEFFAEWVQRFVPKPGTVGDKHRYKKTGEAFWTGGDWFLELCLAGYKGVVTQEHPDGSVVSHHRIVDTEMNFLVQRAIGVNVDGVWGDKSTTACKVFQKAHGLLETGIADMATINKIHP